MSIEEEKTQSSKKTGIEKRLANLAPPYKPGQSGNPKGRPKGKRSFKYDFEQAAREIAKSMRLGKEPDAVYLKLMKKGIETGMKGNYNFWKDLVERLYGKESMEIKVTGKPLSILSNLDDSKNSDNKDTEPKEKA